MAPPARFAALLALALLTPIASADVPSLVSLSGRLTTADGSPLAGPATLGFTIYNDSVVGAPLWTETQNGVALSNGVFSVLLGNVTALDLSFNESYWIAITINGELQNPRLRLAAAPYAVMANRSQNATWADNATRASNATYADQAALARDLDCVGCVGTGELAGGLSGADRFGNGSDGDAAISVDTTLTGTKFYNNLTVNPGVTLKTGGYAIFVKNLLTLDGIISNNGVAGGNYNTPGDGAPASDTGGGGKGGMGVVPALEISENGVDGYIGGAGGNGGGIPYVKTISGVNVPVPFGYGGKATGPPPSARLMVSMLGVARLQGGGGGGGGKDAGSPGSGGGGGGVVLVMAKQVTGAGSIRANGGNGGSATAGFGDSAGGGGGGGGVVFLGTLDGMAGSITLQANGGAGGAGVGSGPAGQAGSNGTTRLFSA